MSGKEGAFKDLLGCFVAFEKPGYILDSIKRGLCYGAGSIMFYLNPPRRLGAPHIDRLRFKDYHDSGLKDIFPLERMVIHAPYVINPASNNPEIRRNTKETLRSQLDLMTRLGLKLYVLHPGSYVNQTKEGGISNLVDLLKEVLTEFPEVTIAIETMAGKGKQLCSQLSEVAEVIKRVNLGNIAICLDTCHLWDYGYNVQDPGEVIAELKELGILSLVKVIHLNDSRYERYSRRDVHENLNGRGKIGFIALREWTKQPVFKDIPFILETPNDIYKQELELLRGTDFHEIFSDEGIPLKISNCEV